MGGTSGDEWNDYPDGIRIETVYGSTYTAHVMLIRDPSSVYLATSTDKFNINTDGTRIHKQIETEGAIAAINAGAFNDDGTAQSYVGSLPIGMVVSEGKILWDDGRSYDGFVGLTEDNVLVVANTVNRGMVEVLQREYNVNVAGPSTMAALLNSLQMGFRTFAIQQRSGEVWKVLSSVKTEFDRFEEALRMTQQRINQANDELDKLVGVRTRQIQRKLKDISIMEDSQ